MNKIKFRRIVVHAIEDGIIALCGVIGVWLVCTVVGNIFTLLGVA